MAKFGNLIRVSFRKLKNIIKDETFTCAYLPYSYDSSLVFGIKNLREQGNLMWRLI